MAMNFKVKREEKQDSPLKAFFKNISDMVKGIATSLIAVGRAGISFFRAVFNLGRIVRDVVRATYNYAKNEFKTYGKGNDKKNTVTNKTVLPKPVVQPVQNLSSTNRAGQGMQTLHNQNLQDKHKQTLRELVNVNEDIGKKPATLPDKKIRTHNNP